MAYVANSVFAGEFGPDIGTHLFSQELCNLDDRHWRADTNIDGLTRRLFAVKS